MRTLPALAVVLLLAAPASAEKIGLQSERGTGERVGLQGEGGTGVRVGLQSGGGTGEALGLQTPEGAVHDAIAAQLWDLSIEFEADDFSIDSDNYKRLARVAELLRQNPTTFIYMQGYAAKKERGVDGRDLAQQRAEVALIYLLLMGIDVEVVELVQPGTMAEKRMAAQVARHRAGVVARAKEAGEKPPPEVSASVRFGVLEQH